MGKRVIKISVRDDGAPIDDSILAELMRVAMDECPENIQMSQIVKGYSNFERNPGRQAAIEAAAQLLKFAQENPT